jgi:hypothetical protein
MMKKSLLMTIVVSLFLTSNSYANEDVVYECSYDSVYWTGRGKSMETEGGDMVVTINGNNLVIKSSSKEMSGTHNLTLKSKLGFQIVALSSSMQFFYNKGSNAFHVNAGIDAGSGFSVSGGGHMGRQVRISGKCSLNQD